MPNWCTGTLKIRGKQKEVRDFLIKGTLKEGKDTIYFTEQVFAKDSYSMQSKEWLYIKETTRGFITFICEWFDKDDEEETVISLIEVAFAWDISAEQLRVLSDKYHIDFKIYAFERGAGFNRDIEIIDGKIITDNKIEFDDYEWDCVCPNKGG